MKLYTSPTSPFGRKAVMTALELGLMDRIERIRPDLQNPTAAFLAASPLCKIPALASDDGRSIVDSPVICEYLCSLVPGATLFPEAGQARWDALVQQALADGVMDAVILRRQERSRPAGQQLADREARQVSKIAHAMAALDRDAAAGRMDGSLTIGQIAVVAAAGYLDFRLPEEDWRADHPALAAVVARLQDRPSVRETVPADAA